MAIEKIPAWDAEYLKMRIGELLDTPQIRKIELKVSASLEEVPTLEYTIESYAMRNPLNALAKRLEDDTSDRF